MRKAAVSVLAIVAASMAASAVSAGETPLVGDAPAWVAPAPEQVIADALKSDAAKGDGGIPLFDQQVLIDGGLSVNYVDSVRRIATAEQLQALGVIRIPWQPAHGDLTFHRLEILRGAERIDLLRGASDFTVLRREAGLEQNMIDGVLTATRQIEDLRIGDVVRMAFSIASRDSVLGGRAQSSQPLIPSPTKLGFGRARLVWPAGQALEWKVLALGVTATPRDIAGGRKELVITQPIARLAEFPADAPIRFRPAPVMMATNFTAWDQLAGVMAPLYRTEGTIKPGGDLAKRVDAIAAAHKDPRDRIAEALRVAQGEVRYQLIALGTGNYAPQAPELTWKSRFGDCKAKTLLLLAMLHRMGITAEPVLANSRFGDLVPQMPPGAMAFDHVFVRAEVDGESLWLDGTRLGARRADIGDTPRMGYVLPLRDKGAQLVQIPQRADARPSTDVDLVYDASAGLYLPAPFVLKARYIGEMAEQLRGFDDETSEAFTKFVEDATRRWTGSTSIDRFSGRYDPAEGVWTLQVEGLAYPDWQFSKGRLELKPAALIGVSFDPDRSKSTWRQLPALIERPWTAQARTSWRLPAEARDTAIEGGETKTLTVPAVAYERSVARSGDMIVETIVSRESGQEVPPADIGALRKAVADLSARPLRLLAPASYPQRWEHVDRLRASPGFARIKGVFDRRVQEKPDDAARLIERAWLAGRVFDWAGAEADIGKAIALDPSIDNYLKRSETRALRGDCAGALSDAQAAYDIEPENGEARSQLAATLAISGKLDEALDLLDANPDLATDEGRGVLAARAEMMLRGGRKDDAIGALDQGLAKQPQAADLLNSRCWIKGLGEVDLEGALADCTRALERSNVRAAVLDSRAMVHFRAGRMKEALADLNEALAEAPELAPTRYMRAVVAKRQGDAALAARDLAIARRLQPGIDGDYAAFGIKP